MKTHQQPDPKTNFRTFALLGVVSAGLMGLFWSLDAFFVYIFAGASLAFFFLAFLRRPQAPVIKSFESHGPKQPGTPQKPTADTVADKPKVKPQQILGCAVILIILMIVIGAIFGDAEDDYAYYYQTAENYRYAGQVDSAKMFYRIASSYDETAEAYLGYGNALLLDTQYDSAVLYYDKALALNPDYVYAYYNQAVARYNQKRYDEAIVFAKHALDLDETYTDALSMTADSFYAKERFDSALYYYESAYKNGMRSAWVSHVMAYLYDRKGERTQAIQFYKEALSYDSSKTEIYPRLAELIGGAEGEKYRALGIRMSQ